MRAATTTSATRSRSATTTGCWRASATSRDMNRENLAAASPTPTGRSRRTQVARPKKRSAKRSSTPTCTPSSSDFSRKRRSRASSRRGLAATDLAELTLSLLSRHLGRRCPTSTRSKPRTTGKLAGSLMSLAPASRQRSDRPGVRRQAASCRRRASTRSTLAGSDGLRLIVDGRTVIDRPTARHITKATAKIELKAGLAAASTGILQRRPKPELSAGLERARRSNSARCSADAKRRRVDRRRRRHLGLSRRKPATRTG